MPYTWKVWNRVSNPFHEACNQIWSSFLMNAECIIWRLILGVNYKINSKMYLTVGNQCINKQFWKKKKKKIHDLVWYAWNVKQWSAQALAHLFTISWGVWSNRNEIRTGGTHKSASAIASWTMDYLAEFQLVNHRIQAKKPKVKVGWALPHPPWLKAPKLTLMVLYLKGSGLWELGRH